MLRKLTILTLTAALVLGGAASTYARGHGGGGGGGGRGFSGGGRGFSGGRGFEGGRGFRGGGWGGGGWGGGGWGGYGLGFGLGYGLGYGAGYGYPYYDGGNYDSGYYAAPVYGYSAPTYVDPGYAVGQTVMPSNPAMTPDMGYTSASMPARANNTALLNIRVPANAKVYFGNTEASNAQSGTNRQFVSPPLEPGSDYQYQLRAEWTENGRTVDRTRTVDIHANDLVNVDFTQTQAPSQSQNRTN